MKDNSYKTLQTRRDYEIEGFTADIQMLRKQIRVLEKQILQTKPLEDQELHLLGIAKHTGEKAEQIASSLHTLKVLFSSLREEDLSQVEKKIRASCIGQSTTYAVFPFKKNKAEVLF